MIDRWIHRRAVLAWLLLPWLAWLLLGVGLAAVDWLLGDAVLLQDWRLRTRSDWLWPGLSDLGVLLAGLYAVGTVAWLSGVLVGGRAARRTCVLLGLLCGAGALALADWAGVAWHQPTALVLGAVALVTGGLYAALTHRPRPRVLRRRPVPPLAQTVLPPPPPRPPAVRPAGPATTVMRHDAPTTQPADD